MKTTKTSKDERKTKATESSHILWVLLITQLCFHAEVRQTRWTPAPHNSQGLSLQVKHAFSISALIVQHQQRSSAPPALCAEAVVKSNLERWESSSTLEKWIRGKTCWADSELGARSWNYIILHHLSLPTSFSPSCVQSKRAHLCPTVKSTRQRRQANRKNVLRFKTMHWDGVCAVYRCPSKYANLQWHVAWFSLWYPCVCVDVSFLEPACWVAWCVCVSVNFGCYLFLGIGWLSRLRTDGWISCKKVQFKALVLRLNLKGMDTPLLLWLSVWLSWEA